MLDGELYVLGRIGDSMKIRGRTVFVEDVEAQVNAAEGIASRKVGRARPAPTARATRWPRSSRRKRGAWVDESHDPRGRGRRRRPGQGARQPAAHDPAHVQRQAAPAPDVAGPAQRLDAGRGRLLERRPARRGCARARPTGIADPGVERFRDRVARADRPLRRRRSSRRRRPSAGSRARRSRQLGREGLFRERWAGGDHGDAGKAVLICEELGRARHAAASASASASSSRPCWPRCAASADRRAAGADRGRARRPRRSAASRRAERANGSDLASVETTAAARDATAGGSRARSATSRSAPSPTSRSCWPASRTRARRRSRPSLTLFARAAQRLHGDRAPAGRRDAQPGDGDAARSTRTSRTAT